MKNKEANSKNKIDEKTAQKSNEIPSKGEDIEADAYRYEKSLGSKKFASMGPGEHLKGPRKGGIRSIYRGEERETSATGHRTEKKTASK